MSTYQKYGRFLPEELSFEITQEPPRKWVNVLCNRIGDWEMYNECTHLGDGTSRIRDREGNQLTLTGYDTKFLYIRNEADGVVFSPFGEPSPTPVSDRYSRIYPGKVVIGSRCGDLQVEQRIFVPEEHPIEIWTVTVTNHGEKTVDVSSFAYAQFALTGTDSEGNGFWPENYATVEPEFKGVYCVNRHPEAPIDWNRGYFAALNDFVGGEAYRDLFLRQDFSVGSPRILDPSYNCSNGPGYGPDCAAALQCKATIEPGASHRFDYVLGSTRSLDDAKTFVDGLDAAKLDAWCDEKDRIERERAGIFSIDVGNELYNNLFNCFIKKQLYTYLINKSGFRDNLQIDAALALVDYDAAKQNLLRALSSQKPSGEVPHGFRPLIRLTYSDKPAWIFYAVSQLIKESGDWGLLDEVVPYLESDESGSVWEHMIRTMRYLAKDTGKHGLCDQHHADWNDGLEGTPESGDRESVMVTEQFCYGLREMIEMARKRGDDAVADEAAELRDEFQQRLNDVAWDGDWYVRTICGDGYKIGSDENPYGKIFQNTQSWAVLSGICDEDRGKAIMDIVEEKLCTDLGYRICFPGWDKYDPRVGRMSQNMPGVNENGGCYNHAAGFKSVADCMLGRPELAWETFCKITPDSEWNPISKSGAEPFTYVNSYSNFELVYGRSGYGWRTGTSGWFTILLLEYILGARRSYEGLIIDPCLTKSIPKAKLTRRFRGATYEIEIDNSAGRCVGTQSVTVDGKPLDGNVIEPFERGVHQVKVVI